MGKIERIQYQINPDPIVLRNLYHIVFDMTDLNLVVFRKVVY